LLQDSKLLKLGQQRLLGLFWESENALQRLLQVQNQPFMGYFPSGVVFRLRNVGADVRRLISNAECGKKILSLVTSSPTNQGRTTKPRPARQSGSLSGNAQTSRRRLAVTHKAWAKYRCQCHARILTTDGHGWTRIFKPVTHYP
jgi:hypothetical protein